MSTSNSPGHNEEGIDRISPIGVNPGTLAADNGNFFHWIWSCEDVSVEILLPCRVELLENEDKTEGKRTTVW